MRLSGRENRWVKGAGSATTLGLLLTLSSCSLPDVNVEKRPKTDDASNAGFFSKIDPYGQPDIHTGGSGYLATVHVYFSDNGSPATFDIHRNKSDLVSFNVQQGEQTSTYMHLGYTHDDGAIAGLRFTWRF